MNWIKDNLIFLLCIVAAGLGVALLLVMLSRANLKTKYATLQDDFSNVSDANETNRANVVEITDKYNKLVEQRQIEQAEAKRAAEAFETYKRSTAKVYETNKQLRDRLAAENPDVQDYLRIGMPQPLACQLWPEAGDCQNPVR